MDLASLPRGLRLGAAVALAALYAPTVAALVHVWRSDTYAGHGMFVPLFSAVIAWTERERLGRAAGRGHPAGAAIVLAGLGLLALGTVAGNVLVGLGFLLARPSAPKVGPLEEGLA